MSQQFECFVEIYDQRYDIVVEELDLSVKFREIYPKVLQIVKIALKEDISFKTHEFELISRNSNIGSVITTTNVWVNSFSTIRISSVKQPLNGERHSPEDRPLNAIPITQSLNTLSVVNEEEYLLKSEDSIKIFKRIVMAINIDWDLKNSSFNWKRVNDKMVDNHWRPKQYFEKSFYRWTQYYTKNFCINGKLSEKCQKIFDLLKFVHILDLDKLYAQNDPILTEIREIGKTAEFVDFYKKHLNFFRYLKIREKVNHSTDPQNIESFARNIIQSKELSDDNLFRAAMKRMCKKIRKFEKEVKKYHNLVMYLYNYWVSKGRADNWPKIFKNYPVKLSPSPGNIFHKWSKYYADNFDILNGKLRPDLQKTFDLLKIVHILDLHKTGTYSPTNENSLKIIEISKKPEIREFFGQDLQEIQSQGIELMEMRKAIEKTRSVNSSLPPEVNKSPKSVQTIERSSETRSQMELRSKRFLMATVHERGVLLSNNSLLENKELKIKAFQRIVLAMNIGWDFRYCANNWEKVSQTINENQFSADFCKNMFYFWSQFYAQNYYKLRLKLTPYYEEMFKGLDVIHSLDLKTIFKPIGKTLSKIEEISRDYVLKQNFRENFKQMEEIKVQSKEENPNSIGSAVSDQHLKAYRRLYNMLLCLTDKASPPTEDTNRNKRLKTGLH